MNERFNELRLDVGIAGLHNEPYLVVINKSGEIIDPLIGLEKFAELIVRECADQFKLVHTDEQYARRIDKTLLKHFGLYE